MARPRKNIDQKEFEKLCGLQCTKEEICGFFDVTDKTLDGWCSRTYKASFSDVFKQKRGFGKIALRRNQFQLSKHNASMAIWLGKQYLGQRETASYNLSVSDNEDDPLTKALKEEAEEMNNAGQ